MLIIYGALSVGGIETFFLRLAKQRKRENLNTKFIFLSYRNESSVELISELEKYAEVFYINDVFFNLGFISKKFHLLAPLKNNSLLSIFGGIKHVHVSHGAHAFLALRFINTLKKSVYITVGFYHSKEFSWGQKDKLPYYERKNREFIFEVLPKSNIYTFSESIIEKYDNDLGVNITGAKTFRLGVIERAQDFKASINNNFSKLMICSVGRLVDFKTYNIWMLDVVKNLVKQGFSVEYHIYGSGPLMEFISKKILELNLNECVILKGNLVYADFNKIVSRYNIFVGSGTSIIQASSLGVCSIVAIESQKDAITYGYFCDNYGIDYNFEQPNIKKHYVLNMLVEFINFSENEKKTLSLRHINSTESFYIDSCSNYFDNINSLALSDNLIINKYFYTFSYFFHKLKIKLNFDSIYHN